MLADGNHCFVLGAGFSKSYSSVAPTMGGFLQTALATGTYQPRGTHEQLEFIIQRYFGPIAEVNIESVASLLVSDKMADLYPEEEHRAEAHRQLIDVILDTLKPIYDKPRSPEVKKVFSKFAQLVIDRHSTVLSLNYDLLIDQLLKDTGQWYPLAGYGVDFPVVGSPGERASAPCPSALLKLHGSLNWVKRNLRYADGSHPLELSLAGARNDDGPILPIKKMQMASRPLSFFNTYIVPPFVTKSSPNEPQLENIWFYAREALARANYIHFLGYSLPPSDFEMDILIREGLHSWLKFLSRKEINGTTIKELRIVDLDNHVCERIGKQFHNVTVHTFHEDICGYLENLIS
jgi:hypothetical protein